VQKYFIKLTKAGIPVPGRTPNLYLYSKKVRQYSSRNSVFLFAFTSKLSLNHWYFQ